MTESIPLDVSVKFTTDPFSLDLSLLLKKECQTFLNLVYFLFKIKNVPSCGVTLFPQIVRKCVLVREGANGDLPVNVK